MPSLIARCFRTNDVEVIPVENENINYSNVSPRSNPINQTRKQARNNEIEYVEVVKILNKKNRNIFESSEDGSENKSRSAKNQREQKNSIKRTKLQPIEKKTKIKGSSNRLRKLPSVLKQESMEKIQL